MNLKSANKIDTNKYEVIVEVEADVFNTEVNKVYRREVKKINIPGFRKGKAPRAIIEKMYGEGVFYDDAIQNLYPGALADAAEEEKLDVVGVDDISVEEAGKQGFTFKAVVFVSPEEVDINGYEGIKIVAKPTEVTEELVNEEIEKVRDRNSRLVTVEDTVISRLLHILPDGRRSSGILFFGNRSNSKKDSRGRIACSSYHSMCSTRRTSAYDFACTYAEHKQNA